jgi:hypothetical protein
MTPLLRKRVGRHVDACDVCGDRKRRVLSPAALLSLVPLVPLPAGLREHVFRLVSDDSPEAAAYRGRVTGRAGAFDAAGFPVQITPPPAGKRPHRRDGGAGGIALLSLDWLSGHGERSAVALAGGAAAIVVLVFGGGITAYVELSGSSSGVTTHAAGHHKSAAGPGASVQPVIAAPVTTTSPVSPTPSTSSTSPPPSMTTTAAAPTPTPTPRPSSQKPKPKPDPSPDPDPSPSETTASPQPPPSSSSSTPTGQPTGPVDSPNLLNLIVSLRLSLPF